MKAYLSASEIAKLMNVHRATVSRWIEKGMIRGVVRPEGSQQWRIPLESFKALVINHENR